MDIERTENAADIGAVFDAVGRLKNQLRHMAQLEPVPELAADIYDYGIMLTGGGSHLRGIGRLISERLGIRVTLAQRPLEAVCRGISKIMESEGQIGELLRYRSR